MTATGSISLRDRALAPDLARGLMLALIALANSVLYLYGRPYGVRQHIVENGLPDRIVSVLTVTLVDARAYPLFAALYAYGVFQILQRHHDKSVIKRRSLWLIVFGFLHAVLLFPGDILGLYGLVGFLLLAVTRAGDRRLLVLAGAWLVVVAVLQGAAYSMPSTGERTFFWSFETAEPIAALILRPVEWLITPFGVAGVGSAVLVGTWAARRGILTDPAAHRTLLVRTAVIGLAVAVAGGLPIGLAVGHFWHTDALWALNSLHAVTGVAGGLGYAALIGLIAIRSRRGRIVRALATAGQRSLSLYLFQSVGFVLVLTPLPYSLGLGDTLGAAGVAAFALLTWLVSVLLAPLTRRGPAEVLLRRLTYRSTSDVRG
ncbi:DUF418 domain-containing protein [Actinoplanes utahensis]|uniref:DUF418 domain-containing protein n=1 Tax=Actinoplanes utahensis TaxID=1869 RepID=A0A0A6UUT5_ACTUT|nr:DUF418 domain-containing protein [Actinoplanes utahensis]KHD78209.1 hypothetical protein MB27_07150 [Actinoplanes utahensis]GIF30730.1 hypothetical protein Aut01nite_37160 [Actinoplanes utahensis]